MVSVRNWRWVQACSNQTSEVSHVHPQLGATTVHKTLGGPRSGLILAKLKSRHFIVLDRSLANITKRVVEGSGIVVVSAGDPAR